MTRKRLTDEIVSEWDVVRRTAEFFDGVLGNVRSFGLTASVTLMGVAFEFNVAPLLLAASLLSAALLFVDRRYQAYLEVTAKYATEIEDQYCFASSGLTHKITEERDRHRFSRPENIYFVVYIILTFAGLIGFVLLTFK